ncbi:type 1 glutamine amidotransferase [Sulfitobacter mediterraneus]|uniref:type 1 glutamine amidotransferase n=1 Tax=Sulfitobacter mediterraneus TaxID=83219 RepID=UPI0013C4B49F|nr:type 1 glutamine amidotransferase [Sulfitobacter mediterraneus]
MPNILIVDSNPAAANAPMKEAQGMTVGENYAAALSDCRDDLSFTIVAPYDGADLPSLDGFDGVVFTGSSVEWNTDDDRAAPVADAMRKVFAQGLPTLGSCNGMQLAASVLGGTSDASPNGREDGLAKGVCMTEAGRDHPLLKGREDGFAVPCVHRDEVTQLPEGAVLLAGNDHSGVQAFAYERNGVKFWGMQYHPELDPQNLGPSLGRMDLLSAQEAQDLEMAERDPAAAERLGVRVSDMNPQTRMTELRNWLASL